jgi:hypothetical protein
MMFILSGIILNWGGIIVNNYLTFAMVFFFYHKFVLQKTKLKAITMIHLLSTAIQLNTQEKHSQAIINL